MSLDRKHFIQFVLLIFIFALGVFIYFASPDYNVKKLAVVSLALLYPIWGVWHHYEHGHLNRQITMEYSLVGLLVLVSFLGILS